MSHERFAEPDYWGLYDLLVTIAQRTPTASAVVDRSFGLRCTYAELLRRVDALAEAWFGMGVTPGSRVLWMGQNSGRVLEGLLVCARLGAIFCPVNWRQAEAELEFVLQDVEPVLVIWQREEVGERMEALQEKFSGPGQRWVQHDGEASEYEACIRSALNNAPAPVEACSEPVLMLYTAAFDGQPNGALLSHRAIIAQSHVFADIREMNAEACYLNVGPLFHVATLLETMATFQAGGTNVFIRRAEAEPICEAIEQEKCTSAFLLPPLIEKIIAHCNTNGVNIKCLRTLGDRPEWNALVTVDDSIWGKLPYGFGQTETFGYATYRALGENALGAMGFPSPVVEVGVFDDEAKRLVGGEVGEIAVRGATVCNGYWRRPDINAKRRIGDWHRCNDLGRIESDGSLSFIGPRARMIRSGQENIYPAEVENCLCLHPAVAEVAVIGVPDPDWDQSVKAIVVLKNNISGESAVCSEGDLIAFCKQRIASYKKPKQIEFVSGLPKSDQGVDYKVLDREFGGGGYPGRDRE